MDGGEDAQMGHHEDGVHRDPGEALKLETLQDHERGTHAVRGVAQDAAGADDQIEAHHVHQVRPAGGL